MSPLRIKICGLTSEAHVDAAAEAGADLVGFVLWPGSVRAVSLERALELAKHAKSAGLATVALVVDAEPSLLARLTAFDRIQFHGSERCDALRDSPRPTIRGFAATSESITEWNACPHADWLLVDGPRGGSGAAFDHASIAPALSQVSKPWLLAGGLTVATVGAAIRRLRPHGVDVSSGVESSRGVKDPERIRAFCQAVRESDARSH
jgi:phosphoribosylanthranilate isomerase